MARNQSAWTNWSQYLAFRMVTAALHSFPVDQNLRSARFAGSMLYRLDHRHRRRAIDNIHRCMPAMPDRQVRRVAEQSMQHFVELAVEVLFTTRLIQPDTWTRYIRFQRIDRALDLILSDRPTIMLTGHYGNWEVLGFWLAMMGIDLSAVARPIDNPLVNDWLLGVRQNHGLNIITKWGATEALVDTLKRGGTVGFIADQNAGDNGMFVPFFGRLASSYKSIGLLALQFDAPVICGYARRSGRRFGFDVGTADIIMPHEWADQPDPLYYITARYNRAIETMIRQVPQQYLWIHRRWKSRPRHERLGRSMPAMLRKQLAQLPWMDETTHDRFA